MSRREYMREYLGRRRAATRANGGIAPVERHGTTNTATNWGCLCGPCRETRTVQTKRAKKARFARTAANDGVAPVEAHGIRSTYTDWGCKCDACRSAATAYSRQVRARRREAS